MAVSTRAMRKPEKRGSSTLFFGSSECLLIFVLQRKKFSAHFCLQLKCSVYYYHLPFSCLLTAVSSHSFFVFCVVINKPHLVTEFCTVLGGRSVTREMGSSVVVTKRPLLCPLHPTCANMCGVNSSRELIQAGKQKIFLKNQTKQKNPVQFFSQISSPACFIE